MCEWWLHAPQLAFDLTAQHKTSPGDCAVAHAAFGLELGEWFHGLNQPDICRDNIIRSDGAENAKLVDAREKKRCAVVLPRA